jgi:formate hydrogenlyase subunit 3/multisubunit Na+/H+ antiporter MnhD subunit
MFPNSINVTKKECFRIPYGGTIFGIVIGIIIILVEISMMPGIDLKIWTLMLLIFGVMIVTGSLYALKQRG